MRYLIIGNGIAGVCAAEAIRELDPRGTVAMVGDEATPPYSRPMISQVLDGSQPHEKLFIRPTGFYEEAGIEAILGQRAASIDPDARSVTLADGKRIGYDRLLIASGADPRPLRAEGLELEKIHYMRTEAHVRSQLSSAEGARRALVLGGGLVGFKAAYGLLRRGLSVTMLIASGYPLSMQVDAIAGRMILDELSGRGLDVRVGESVTAFEGNGTVQAALTDGGQRLACDMVVIGKGVLPALDFVPRDRIDVDLGILVDEHLRTTADGVYAAGDAAECVDIARGRRWVNAIWPEAAAQGRIAGWNMAGRKVAFPGSLSRNVMRVYDLDVMTLGLGNPEEDGEAQVVRTGGPAHGFYRCLAFRDGLLAGAVLVNRIEQGGVLRALIENRVPLSLPPAALADPHFNFARLLP